MMAVVEVALAANLGETALDRARTLLYDFAVSERHEPDGRPAFLLYLPAKDLAHATREALRLVADAFSGIDPQAEVVSCTTPEPF